MTEALYERAELYLSAKNLVDKDVFSKSDPFAVLFRMTDEGQWLEIGRTAVMQDNLNPVWGERFEVDYHFESVQKFKVSVYDEDSKGNPDLSRHDLLGDGVFNLGDLMTARGQGLSMELVKGKRAHRGTVVVRGEAIHNTRDIFRVQFKGLKLANKDGLFGRSDPFITAFKLREDNSWVQVWKSEVIDNNLSPTWGIAEIPMQHLCNGDMDRPIKLEIWDYDNEERSESMGQVETSVRALVEDPSRAHDVVEPEKKAKKKGYKNSGTLMCNLAQVEHRPLFMDYLKGGCQLSLTVAIDFTGSNGHPLDAGSLHYIDPSGRTQNEYQLAINSVGRILEAYDTDKKFPVYGFGAVVGSAVSHCFTVYPAGVEVDRVQGILDAYQACVTRVQFSGPTLFAPILRAAIARAAAPAQQQQYHVLLILCDGVINDMPATVDALVEASTLPISVIIVGVGDADFSDMSRLDGDDGVLRNSRNEPAARDIVQFVPFRKFGISRSSELAKEILEEIPGQFLGYMAARGITPNPPVSAPEGTFDAPPAYEEKVDC